MKEIISFASLHYGGSGQEFLRLDVMDPSLFSFVRPASSDAIQRLGQHIAGWHGDWSVFAAAAAFAKSPSTATLAHCLREIVDAGMLSDVQNLCLYLPWPIGSVIYCASDMEKLATSAAIAEAGEFGDKEAWIAAERRWTSAGISLEDLRAGNVHGPFGREVASIGAPLINVYWKGEPQIEPILRFLEESRKLIVNTRFSTFIANTLRWSLAVSGRGLNLNAEQFLKSFEGLPEDADWLYLDLLACLDKGAFHSRRVIEFVSEKIANARNLYVYSQLPVDTLIGAYRRYPKCRPILYPIAAGYLRLEPGASAWPPDDGELLGQLPSSAFDWQDNDVPCTMAGVAALRVLRFEKSTEAEIAALTGEPDLDLRVRLAEHLANRFSSWERVHQMERTAFLVNLPASLAERAPFKAPWLYKLLTRELDARKSGMFDRATWVDQLRLPEDAFPILSRQVS